jgi:hypothetical protein
MRPAGENRGGKRQGAGRKRGGKSVGTLAKEAAIAYNAKLTAEATIEQIRRGMMFDVRRLFDKGRFRSIHELSEEEAACIAGFEVVKRNITAGDGKVDTVLKIKLIDRSKYVEMAAKHHRLLADVVELPGLDRLADKIARARQRAAKG